MVERTPPDERSVQQGYEAKDLWPKLVVGSAIGLVVFGVVLHVLLWGISQRAVPEQGPPGVSPPVVMPGEAPVNDRVLAVPAPRLDPLEPLAAVPPSYRPSAVLPGTPSPAQRPEDLRADRQAALNGYDWVVKGKVARIPVAVAMDAVVEMEKAKAIRKEPTK